MFQQKHNIIPTCAMYVLHEHKQKQCIQCKE